MAVFDIRRENMLTTDPDPTHRCGASNARCQIQSGELRTQGIELEAKTEPLRGLTLVAGYSLLDNAYSKANPGTTGQNLKGKAPVDVSSQQISTWGRYPLQGGPLAGLGVDGGVRDIGSSHGNEANTMKVPAVDLMLDYDLGRVLPSLKGMQMALNVAEPVRQGIHRLLLG